MKDKNNLKVINWTIFVIVVLTAIITASLTLYELSETTQTAFGDEAQSRAGFRWGLLHNVIAAAILLISAFLAIGWKRLFPFNVPVAVILVGFCYVLFFLTFTVGWVGIQGMFGFVIAFLIGVILIIAYSVSILMEYRKMDS